MALLSSPPCRLDRIPSFTGAGIYALYYTGDHPLYDEITPFNRDNRYEAPFYIGKAVPPGTRKGILPNTDTNHSTKALFTRIAREHASSLNACTNLEIEHFYARWLVVDSIWIPLGESVLINWFHPLWNQHLDGFGNHDPGKGRRNGQNSRWDTIHPGRSWTTTLKPRNETEQEITESLRTEIIRWRHHLKRLPPAIARPLPTVSERRVR